MKIRVTRNQAEEIEGLYPDYPYVMHRADVANTKVPWHWHEEIEIGWIEEGSVEVITANESHIFLKGEAFFMNTNVMSTMRLGEGALHGVLVSHIFHPVLLSGHYKSIFETKYMEPVLKNKKIGILAIRGENDRQKEMLVKLRRLRGLQEKEDTEFQTRNLLSDLWLLLLEEIRELEQRGIQVKPVSQERIQTMMSYIKQNYAEKITLEEIASSALLSTRECLRCFQHMIQKTPFEFLMEYRVEMAERLLRTTDERIVDIALQTGFSNSAYFGKVFKGMRGMTPGEYRRRGGTKRDNN